MTNAMWKVAGTDQHGNRQYTYLSSPDLKDPRKAKKRAADEFKRRWMKENPALFAERVIKFHTAYPAKEWKHELSLHSTWQIKLIAIRRVEPFDLDRDYLKEIGMGK